jgi:uncharacterized protein YjbI with pentapeptide repeats
MSNFVCKVDGQYRSACKDLPEYQGTGYCVLHYPGEEKNKEAFLKVIKSKLDEKDYNFGGTVFPEGTANFEEFEFDDDVYFSGVTLLGEARFAKATFSGKLTAFREAQFSGSADFSGAKFSSERITFPGTKFGGEHLFFSDAQFSGSADFSGAKFSSELTYFRATRFNGESTSFSRAQFSSEATYFYATAFMQEVGAWVWFSNCRVDKPERLRFNSVLLHPGCFINTDVRKVDFTDVKWYGMPGGPKGTLDEEIHALEDLDVKSPHTLLAQACRRLSANAEENREYPLANEFHYWSMNALRKLGWSSLGLVGTLYWALSGYGVRAARAFWVLVVIWLVFAAFYLVLKSSPFWVFAASDIWQGLDYARQAAVYSLSALARLNPRPQYEGLDWFQTFVTIEGILGPLQIALLALAIRRKVMR